MGSGYRGYGAAFYIETLKSWNKLHDPRTDAAIENCNYFVDEMDVSVYVTPKPMNCIWL